MLTFSIHVTRVVDNSEQNQNLSTNIQWKLSHNQNYSNWIDCVSAFWERNGGLRNLTSIASLDEEIVTRC